jgi:branched-chain amino acid transport system substrate-binding protein
VKKANRVAILQDQAAPYSVGLADEFEKHFKKMGGEITTRQSYNGGEQDFAARLTTIRATNPDMIFVPGYYTDVANIAIQARKLGINVPLLGGDGWDSAKLGEIAGPSIDGCFYANHYSHEDPSPTIQEFIRKYQDEYGAVPDGLAALGYDAAKLLFDAMGRAKSLSGKDLAAAIAATKDFKGVTGNITIDPERNAVKSAVIVEMKGGSPHYVTTIAP